MNRDILATSRCRSLLSLLQQGGYALLCFLLSILSLDAQEVGEGTARSPHLRAVGTGRIVVTTDTPIGQGIYFQIEAKGDIRFEGASYSGGSVLLIDEPQFVIYGDVTSIFFGPSQITSIDLSQSPTIEDLTCASNKLSQLTLTGARSLKYLNCKGNMLTHLDLSDCNSLETLYCSQNQLSSLDVSHCGLLQELWCGNNQLTHIALPESPSFKHLECYANQIRGEAMTQLVNSLPDRKGKEAGFFGIMSTSPQEGNLCFKSDVRIATKKNWNARKIKLTSTDGGTYEPYEGEDGGETTGSVVTLITSKQIGDKITLAIGASSSVIIDGIEGTPTVDNWEYSYKITSQQITIRGDLTWLGCARNSITDIDVSKCSSLRQLDCSGNQLTHLDLSQNALLDQLSCGGNDLGALDLSHCMLLENIWCRSAGLTSLQLPRTLSLVELSCSHNPLKDLDLTYYQHLEELYCVNNGLTSLDLSQNRALIKVYCGDNELTTLDLSHHKNLKILNCAKNKLTKLILPQGGDLSELDCSYNRLSQLDILQCRGLREVSCHMNRIQGEAMTQLVKGLSKDDPEWSKDLYAVSYRVDEENICLISDVAIARSKNWKVYMMQDEGSTSYEGLDMSASYPVILSSNRGGHITIVENVDSKAVPCGTKITIQAICDSDAYELTALTANGTDILATKKFVVKEATEVKATFTKMAFAVTLTKEGEGTLTATGADDLTAVPYGTELTIAATPAEGYELTVLTANGEDILATKKFVVKGATEVKATFSKKSKPEYRITFTTDGNGTLNAIKEGAPFTSGSTAREGDKIIFTAQPATGYKVDKWLLSEAEIELTPYTGLATFECTVGTADVLLKTTFVQQTFTVTLTSNEHGTISIVENVDLKAVPYGTTLTVKATGKNDQCELTALTANGSDILATKQLVVKGKTEVKATFVDHTNIAEVNTEAIRFYPNPAREYIIVEGTLPATLVTLYSMEGMRLYEDETDAEGTLRIDLSAYAEGTYLLRIADQIHRIIVQH